MRLSYRTETYKCRLMRIATHQMYTSYLVRAFSWKGKGGSQTAVVVDADHLSLAQRKQIARVSGTSHTVFMEAPLSPVPILHFFTPAGELLNCAHATLAAQFIRWHVLEKGKEVSQLPETSHPHRLFFRQGPVSFLPMPTASLDFLLSSLGLQVTQLDNAFPPVLASAGNFRVLLGVGQGVLDKLTPDFTSLANWSGRHGVIGCFVYSFSSEVSGQQTWARMFAPAIGINEDAVNGNSCGCLAVYTKRSLHVFQGNWTGHPGLVEADLEEQQGVYQCYLGGEALLEKKIIQRVPDLS